MGAERPRPPRPSSPTIREAVRWLLQTTELCEPLDIAATVLNEHLAGRELEALRECLPAYVRILLTQFRHQSRGGRSIPTPSSTDDHAWNGRPPRPNRFMLISTVFANREYVNGEWRMLGDFTQTDVKQLASDRRRQADDMHHKAKKYEALHHLMVSEQAEYVRDLDENKVQEILR